MKFKYVIVLVALAIHIPSLGHASETRLFQIAEKMEDAFGKYITYSYSLKNHDLSKGKKISTLSKADDFMKKLLSNGLTAVHSGQYLKIINLKQVRSSTSKMLNANDVEDHEFYTDIIDHKNGCGLKLPLVLRYAVQKDAHMVSYKPVNAVIVTETKAQIVRIKALVKGIEKEMPTGTTCKNLSPEAKEIYAKWAKEIEQKYNDEKH